MSAQATTVTGGCQCGRVRYEAEAYLDRAHYCHCAMCRRYGGGAFDVGVPLRIGTLRFTHGEPAYFASSEWAERGFCPDCGSRLIYRLSDPAESWATSVCLGSLDNPEDVRPEAHIFVEHMLPWVEADDGLPRYTGDEVLAMVPQKRAEALSDAMN